MNDHLIQLLTTAASAIAGICAYLKARQAASQVRQNTEQLHEIKISINGRLDELLNVTRSEAHAQGLNAGMASNQKASEALHAAELNAALLQAEALKAEAVRVAEALKLADAKAAELRAAQVQSAGHVTVTGSPINIIETKDDPERKNDGKI